MATTHICVHAALTPCVRIVVAWSGRRGPLQKEFRLPTGSIQLGHGEGQKCEVVGQVGPCLVLPFAPEADTTKLPCVMVGRTRVGEHGCLIAEESGISVHGAGVEASELEVALDTARHRSK